MNQTVKVLLIIIGTFFVGLAFLGVVLPLLPTTPFLLAAAACYAKSSDRFYNWLLNNRWFGEYIRNYRAGKGIPLKTKVLAITLLILTIGYSAIFVVPVVFVKILLVFIAVGVSLHILHLPTLEYKTRRR
jgi:uncharacterized membrane protein YbaN (DUF454 family)